MRWFLSLILLALFTLAAACTAQRAEQPLSAAQNAAEIITVYKSPTCGCCSDWIAHLKEAGFTVEAVDRDDLAAIKAQHQVPARLQSCHTALVDGYVIEGHVPAREIHRLLTERPPITGLAVPGMPIGSPGMEIDGFTPEPYDVLAFTTGQADAIYASYR
jgi:hypothetical protein